MSAARAVALSLLAALSIAVGACSDSGGPKHEPESGKITARADGIQGQSGKWCAVFVYGYDWFPGAEGEPAGIVGAPITSDGFSFSAEVQEFGFGGRPTEAAKQFEPGTYSVVFFISTENTPPEYFAEIRATVDGDITVSAPAWGNWTQTR